MEIAFETEHENLQKGLHSENDGKCGVRLFQVQSPFGGLVVHVQGQSYQVPQDYQNYEKLELGFFHLVE